MLKEWLSSTSPPTWSGLVQALSTALVGEQRLAEDIRKQYCRQDGEQATSPAPGEVFTVEIRMCKLIGKLGGRNKGWGEAAGEDMGEGEREEGRERERRE